MYFKSETYDSDDEKQLNIPSLNHCLPLLIVLGFKSTDPSLLSSN